jgi:hypothetical protein
MWISVVKSRVFGTPLAYFLGLCAAALSISPGLAAKRTANEALPSEANYSSLTANGFTEIKNIAARYDRNIVEACREGLRLLLIVSRDGQPVARNEVGTCGPARQTASTGANAPGAIAVAYREEREEPSRVRSRESDFSAPWPPSRQVPPISRSIERPRPSAAARRWDRAGGGANAEEQTESAPSRALEREEPPERPLPPRESRDTYTSPWRDNAPEGPRRLRTAGPMSVGDIELALKRMSYNNISVLDDRAPVYLAEACRDQIRFRIALDRTGNVVDKDEIGPCFRKLMGIGLDDVQGAIKRILGCESAEALSPVRFSAWQGASQYVPLSFGTSLAKAGFGNQALTVNSLPRRSIRESETDATPSVEKVNTIATSGIETILPAKVSHNGSTMDVVHEGTNLAVIYREPRSALRGMNIVQGTALFTGTIKNGLVTGLAATFSSRCPLKLYPVSGSWSGEPSKLELKGRKPTFGPQCEDGDAQDEALSFEIIPQTVAALN